MVFEVILGGVIAGVVGVATSVFQVNRHFKKQRGEEADRWKRRMDHLIERLEPPFDNKEMERFDESRVKQAHIQTIKRVQPLLDDHISNAPLELDEGFWKQVEFVDTAFTLPKDYTGNDFQKHSEYLYERAIGLKEHY